VLLCGELNARGAEYLVVGGFAVIVAGLPRATGDINLLIAANAENEARVFQALEKLPDQCVKELTPGEVEQYVLVRVADEILVDLMVKASGIDYAEASKTRSHSGDRWSFHPFCEPSFALAHEEPDPGRRIAGDLEFLRRLLAECGELPGDCPSDNWRCRFDESGEAYWYFPQNPSEVSLGKAAAVAGGTFGACPATRSP